MYFFIKFLPLVYGKGPRQLAGEGGFCQFLQNKDIISGSQLQDKTQIVRINYLQFNYFKYNYIYYYTNSMYKYRKKYQF